MLISVFIHSIWYNSPEFEANKTKNCQFNRKKNKQPMDCDAKLMEIFHLKSAKIYAK